VGFHKFETTCSFCRAKTFLPGILIRRSIGKNAWISGFEDRILETELIESSLLFQALFLRY
jgi:hypothetical protein